MESLIETHLGKILVVVCGAFLIVAIGVGVVAYYSAGQSAQGWSPAKTQWVEERCTPYKGQGWQLWQCLKKAHREYQGD